MESQTRNEKRVSRVEKHVWMAVFNRVLVAAAPLF